MNDTDLTPEQFVELHAIAPVRQLPPMFYNVDKVPALFAALAAAQAAYAPVVRDKKVEQRLKDKTTGEYDNRKITFFYADMSAILAATVPALSANGLTFLQPLEYADDVVWLNSILAHKEGGMIISRLQIPGANDIKAFGGNITYFRRYAGGPLLGVSAEDDAEEDGNGAGEPEWPPQTSQRTPVARTQPARKSAAEAPATADASGAKFVGISSGQLANINSKIKAVGLNADAVMQMLIRLNVPAIDSQMTEADWKKVKAEVEKAI